MRFSRRDFVREGGGEKNPLLIRNQSRYVSVGKSVCRKSVYQNNQPGEENMKSRKIFSVVLILALLVSALSALSVRAAPIAADF
jgi:hypothetical protein